MKVLLCEYAVGGGLPKGKILSSLFCEGYAMLVSLLEDFHRAGATTLTTLDQRLLWLAPHIPADEKNILSPEDLFPRLQGLLEGVDAALIIAPEEGGILSRLVRIVEEGGEGAVSSLNSSPEAIEGVSDKALFYHSLEGKGIVFPRTVEVSMEASLGEVVRSIKALSYPLIFKPRRGVNCIGLSRVDDPSDIPKALEKLRREAVDGGFLVQEFIEGIPASVSLIATEEGVKPLTLNGQVILLEGPSSPSHYLGGVVPLDHPLKEAALEVAGKVVKAFKGLRGYVGVDLILTDERIYVVEVNPRITTSYIGARRVLKINMAEVILEAVMENRFPQDVKVEGYSLFSKIPTLNLNPSQLDLIWRLEGVVAPPIPGEGEAWSLIATSSITLKSAREQMKTLERSLQGILSKGEER